MAWQALACPHGIFISICSPIDRKVAVNAFLSHWRSDIFILAELDLWPLMLHALSARGTLIVMVRSL